jgi:hypothetical protein
MQTATTWPTDAEIIGDGNTCRVIRRDWPKGSRFFVYLADGMASDHACQLLDLPAGCEEEPERWQCTDAGQILHYWQRPNLTGAWKGLVRAS